MDEIRIYNKPINLEFFLRLGKSHIKQFIEDCRNSCFNAGCCYQTGGAITENEANPTFDFSSVEDCRNSCFNAGCCYQTGGAITENEANPTFDFSSVEDCRNSCFNVGRYQMTEIVTSKKECIITSKHPVKLSSVHIELTHNCNHNCFYCFNTVNNHIPIDKDKIKNIANIADSIVITGGEPFINPAQVKEIVAYATFIGLKHISINTNASLLNKDIITDLAKINSNLSFLISVPTVNNNHYKKIVGVDDLDRVLDNIRLLLKTFGENRVVANMVIHQLNKDDIAITAETLYQLGIRLLQHSFMIPYKDSNNYQLNNNDIDDIFNSLVNIKNNYNWMMFGSTHAFPLCRIPDSLLNNQYPFVKCGAGKTMASVSTDGLLYPCPSMSHHAISIDDYINKRAKLLSHADVINNIQQPCKDCDLLAYCGAGCMCENELTGGNIYSSPLYAKQLSKNEVLLRKISLGIQCNINDILDFENIDGLYSRVRFCNEWLNSEIVSFSNDLVSKITGDKLSTTENNKLLQSLLHICQVINVA